MTEEITSDEIRRDYDVVVAGGGAAGLAGAVMLARSRRSVLVIDAGEPRPEGAEASQLAARGVTIIEGEVGSLEIAGDRLTGVRLREGRVIPVDAVAVALRFAARASVLAGLGLQTVPHPLGAEVGEFIPADPAGLTAVPGVWVAGNVSNVVAQVIGAAAAGAQAGAAINGDLVAEDAEQALSASAAPAGSR